MSEASYQMAHWRKDASGKWQSIPVLPLAKEKPQSITAHAPDTCDVCKGKLRSGRRFYDANTCFGSWGWLCHACFRQYGRGLGTGVGQEFDSATNIKLRG